MHLSEENIMPQPDGAMTFMKSTVLNFDHSRRNNGYSVGIVYMTSDDA